jgi:hypothetical protein
MVPMLISIGVIYGFYPDNSGQAWLLFILYPLSIMNYTYVTSFLFAQENGAQNFTVIHHFFFSGIGVMVIYILTLIPSRDIAQIIVWFGRIIPSFCLTNGYLRISTKSTMESILNLVNPNDFDKDIAGGDLIFMIIHIAIWPIILTLVESGLLNKMF